MEKTCLGTYDGTRVLVELKSNRPSYKVASLNIILTTIRFLVYYMPRQCLNRYMQLLLMTPHLNYAMSLLITVPI